MYEIDKLKKKKLIKIRFISVNIVSTNPASTIVFALYIADSIFSSIG
jgi:hypothetical protein